MEDTSNLSFPSITYQLLLLIFPIFLLHVFWKKKSPGSDTTPRRLPSPPALPVIGHLHLMAQVVQKSFHSIASRYGPILYLRMGFSDCVLVSSSHFAKEILKTQEPNFASRPEFAAIEQNTYKNAGFVGARYGTYWRFMKKLCMTRLLSTSQLNQLVHIREDEIKDLLRSLMECSMKGESCDLEKMLVRLTNNITCRMAMSTRCSGEEDEANEVKDFVDEIVFLGGKLSLGEVFGPWVGKLDLFGYGKRLTKALAKFDRMMNKIIEKKERMAAEGGRTEKSVQDLLDILLECSKDPDAEFKLTKLQIKGFLLDVFTGGTETTATAIQWAMAELINNPRVFRKLREEIESVTGSTRLITESDLPRLPYLQAVFKETLRLHPPLIFTLRECKEDCTIHGFQLKAKSRMLINLYSIMRDPDHWIEPYRFNPDRFMAVAKTAPGFEYLPFGSGRRSCPGASLASLEAQTVVGSLVQCFDWKAKDGERVDMEEGSDGITLKMEKPLVCYPILHFDQFAQTEIKS